MFALEVGSEKNPEGDASKIEDVGVCGKKAKYKRNEYHERRANNEGARSDGSQATAAATELTAVPPLLSHHNKQQHSKQLHRSRQLAAASAPATKTSSTCTGNSNASIVVFNFGAAFVRAFFSSCAAATCCCAHRTRATAPARSASRTPGAGHLDRAGLTPRRRRRC